MEESTKETQEAKINDAYIQVAISFFNGVLGGMTVNMLGGGCDSSLPQRVFELAFIAFLGFVIFVLVAHKYNPTKKIGKPLAIGLLLILAVALSVCCIFCVKAI